MARVIYVMPVFERRLLKFLKHHPELRSYISRAIKLLEQDIKTPSLKTHRLHGKLSDSYACNVDYRYRIIFSFDDDYVYLESIGAHDDVY